ncbi:MAG: 5-formyltetrahydrofolate cyclo-ligase [Clostridia bacterium]|nr:5-formyltetrahydrofolate cyclo-ligase [Clostridia bacterium]
MTKSGLRALLKKKRDSLSPEERKKLSREASARVVESSVWKRCRKIALYCPIKSEADPEYIKNAALREKKTLLYPKCLGNEMEFFASDGKSGFSVSRFGIPEPQGSEPETDFSDTLMIIPCLGVDEKFFRLGWGGGFYDRFFARHRPAAAIGFVFSLQIVPSVFPEAHDAALDGTASEKGLVLRG